MWEKGLKSEEDDILDLLINLKKSGNEPLLSILRDQSINCFEWALAEIDILAKASENWIECGVWVLYPKGSQVLLSRPGLGRNPRVWDEPLRFRPKRHVHDEDSVVVLTDPELHMLSFSTGRRGCPGVVLGSTPEHDAFG
ncbi:hypothetical protein SASPL_141566 [Salvia splendens]|uniref:Tryptophan N-monooxygenase n=1 Tax=Salvia splendens TaxID=180675 RepID=A0A8X8ZCZ6_SALSN|nr:hypothetical protein SASPL_141566 [Salvia splendens]